MRIQKYLSDQGICSRREAEEFIRRGLVSVNGKVVTEMGVQIDPGSDSVTLSGRAVSDIGSKRSVIVNKPRGIVSSRIPSEGKTVYDLFPEYLKLDIVGRLDKESEGLLLLSEDGVVAKAVTGDRHITEKEYEVTVREKINRSKMDREFSKGMALEDGVTLPAKVSFSGERIFRVTLREGRKHQIRRMCAKLDLTITKLKRLRIGPVKLGDLKPGESRILSRDEVAALKKIS